MVLRKLFQSPWCKCLQCGLIVMATMFVLQSVEVFFPRGAGVTSNFYGLFNLLKNVTDGTIKTSQEMYLSYLISESNLMLINLYY